MTNMNGKIFVHNKTGNKYFVLNEAIDANNCSEGDEVVVYTRIDSDDQRWFIRDYYEFMAKFTEVEWTS